MRKAIILVLVFCSVLLGAQNYGTVGQPSGGPPGGTDDQLLSISNDTLTIEDGNFVVLPDGADSLGTSGDEFGVLVRTGGRGAASYSGFDYFPGPGNLLVTGWLDIADNFGSGAHNLNYPTWISLGSDQDSAQSAYILFNATSPGFGEEGTITRQAGANGNFDFKNKGTGSINLKAGTTTRFEMKNTGQLAASAYTSTSSFPGTEVAYLAVDASGNILSKANPNTNDGLGSSPTTGAILFGQGTTTAAIDASNFFYDSGSRELGIGTNAPAEDIHVLNTGANAILRLDRGSGSYADFISATSQFLFAAVAPTASIMDFVPTPSDGTSNASTRFFRTTNTTGSTYADFHLGDGTSTSNARIASKGLNTYFALNNGNVGIRNNSYGTSAVGVLGIGNGTAPSTSPANMVQIYAEDVSSSSELKVRDEAGNITTLSPHNFSLIPEGPSEPMAWSYYSEKDGKKINVDMLKLARMVEELTGEKLIYIE